MNCYFVSGLSLRAWDMKQICQEGLRFPEMFFISITVKTEKKVDDDSI